MYMRILGIIIHKTQMGKIFDGYVAHVSLLAAVEGSFKIFSSSRNFSISVWRAMFSASFFASSWRRVLIVLPDCIKASFKCLGSNCMGRGACFTFFTLAFPTIGLRFFLSRGMLSWCCMSRQDERSKARQDNRKCVGALNHADKPNLPGFWRVEERSCYVVQISAAFAEDWKVG